MTQALHRRGAIVLAILFALGLWWSWGTWPDVLIDFGRELYTPWRVSQGDVLYREVAYFNGPFSPYLNSLWFRLFGATLLTLVVANTVVLAVTVLLVYRLVDTVFGTTAATLGSITFLSIFAFGQYLAVGNYNWICPYSHEITHGVMLSLLALYLAWRHTIDRRWWTAAGSRLALGLVFLTKPEVFLAAAIGVSALITTNFRTWKQTSLLWAAAVLLPPILAFGLLATRLTPHDALIATLGGWAYLFDGRISGNLYFRTLMGIDDPLANLAAMGRSLLAYAIALAAITGLSLVFGRSRSPVWQGVLAVFLILAVPLWFAHDLIPWETMARPWPVLLVVLLAAAIVQRRRMPTESPDEKPASLRIALVVFAIALTFKLFLNLRVPHYGFALAMPAAVLLVAAAWTWLPPLASRWAAQPAVFRAGLLAVWLVTLLAHVELSSAQFARKTLPVGSGRDQFWADQRTEFDIGRGEYVAAILDYLNTHARADDRVAVLPEGVMINYLTRHRTPGKFQVYLPPEMAMFGEEQMLAELERHPPEWVILIHRDDSEYGVRFFGRDYGQKIGAWVQANYQGVQLFGAHPLTSPQFGVLITRRAARIE